MSPFFFFKGKDQAGEKNSKMKRKKKKKLCGQLEKQL